MDDKLLKQVAGIKEKTGKQLRFRLSDDRSSVVWIPCGGQELCPPWAGKRLSLAIDEVILPLLRDSQAFVAEAACALEQHARLGEVCTPGSEEATHEQRA